MTTYLLNTTPVFKIFKAGMTLDGPVTILKMDNEPFDIEEKTKFYQSLGYTVIPLTN